MTKMAMSTLGQGANSYIAFLNWNHSANSNTGQTGIEFDISLDNFRGASIGYLLGASGSTQNALRVDAATMQLQFRTGAQNRVVTDDNAVVLGRRMLITLIFDKSNTTYYAYLNGALLGSWVGAASAWNQFGRFSSTVTTGITLYSVRVWGPAASYTAEWDETTAVSSGQSWTSAAGNRLLTITNAEGAADSWWKPYGASEHFTGGALLAVAADFTAGGSVQQRQHITGGALLAIGADLIAGGSAQQRQHVSSGALLAVAADFTAGGSVQQRQHITGGALLAIGADLVAGGYTDNGGQHFTGGALLTIAADLTAGGSAQQWQRFTGGALLPIAADLVANGAVSFSQHVTGGALLAVAADLTAGGSVQQRQHVSGGALLAIGADLIAGGEVKLPQAIKKLRHRGSYLVNDQIHADHIHYVQNHPENFNALLYVVDNTAAPAQVDDWLETPVFGRPDVNQQAVRYADPVVCCVLERPRESVPFSLDNAGEFQINEHEDYLTVCIDRHVPTGSALEFEEEIGFNQTRRSWWYVHHSTTLGTTTAGAIHYLIPLRDFTGLH